MPREQVRVQQDVTSWLTGRKPHLATGYCCDLTLEFDDALSLVSALQQNFVEMMQGHLKTANPLRKYAALQIRLEKRIVCKYGVATSSI